MPAPTTPVLDNFGGVAGTALTTYDPTDWAQFSGTTETHDAVISTPNGACASFGGNNVTDYWLPSFGADDESYATISKMPVTDGLTFILFARVQNPTNSATINGYELRWTYAVAGADTFELYKLVAGTNTQIAVDTSGSFDPVIGDKLWLNVTGTTITGYLFHGGVWTQILQVTDAAVSGAGRIGFFNLGSTAAEFTAFGGGTVSAGGGSTFVPKILAYG